VSNNGVDFCQFPLVFIYYKKLQILEILPKQGYSCTIVTVLGFGLIHTDSLKCSFASKFSVTAYFISATEIKCTCPAIKRVGKVDIEVTLNGNDYTSDFISFRYVRKEGIRLVNPTSGLITGNTTILVTGYEFMYGTLYHCRFGSKRRVVSSTQFDCISPANLEGNIALFLNYYSGKFIETSYSFDFYENIELIFIYPCEGVTTSETAF